jgi:hypothetical protein
MKQRSNTMKSPYNDGASSRFWASGVKKNLENNENFKIDSLTGFFEPGSTICSAGSCFAQHIGKNLIDRNYKFLLSAMSEGRKESFGFGNIYTTRQMKQWLEFFLRRRNWSDQTLY